MEAISTPDRAERGADRRSWSPSRGTAPSRPRRACRRPRTPGPARSAPASWSGVRVEPLRLTVPPAWPRAEQQPALDVRDHGDDEHRHHHERDDGDELGHEQPGPADRPDEQVAQRARLAPRRRWRRRRARPPRWAGTAAARRRGRPAGTACRRSARRTGTAGRCPGRGARSVTASRTATRVGRATSIPMITQVRGRRTSLTSSTPITAPPGPQRDGSPRARPARGRGVRARARRPGRRSPTRCRFRPAASSARTSSRSPSTCDDGSSEQGVARSGVRGVARATRPVGRSRASSRSCRTSRPRSRTPTRVHSCSISASRWLDRKMVVPPGLSASSSSRISWMPCGSRPLVGSSRMSSRGRRISAAARPSRWRMPERVRPGRPPVGRVEPDLRPAPRRPGGAGSRLRRSRPGSRPAGSGWPGRTGAGTRPGPRRGRRPGAAPSRRAAGIGSPSTSATPDGRQHQPEQHPDGRRLARAVRAEEAVDVALARPRGRSRRRPGARRSAWSAPGADHCADPAVSPPDRAVPTEVTDWADWGRRARWGAWARRGT